MAKRYEKFDDLPSHGRHKPGCTMGTHDCFIETVGCGKKIRGSVSGVVFLRSGETLGYDCGNVWKVPSPQSYKDPIRRLLAEKKISQKSLIFSNEVVCYSFGWTDTSSWPSNSAADPSAGQEVRVLGAHKTEEKYDDYDRWTSYSISGGHAIIVYKIGNERTVHNRSRIVEKLVIRTSANKAEVYEWLKEILKNYNL